MSSFTMIPGQRYRVKYISNNWKLPREMVATFLDVDDRGLSFSGRPTFGTAVLDERHYKILEVNPVASNTPAHPPKTIRS